MTQPRCATSAVAHSSKLNSRFDRILWSDQHIYDNTNHKLSGWRNWCFGWGKIKFHFMCPMHGSMLPQVVYRMNSKHSGTFQYLEPCRVAIQYRMLAAKEGLQLPCSCQHWHVIFTHALILDLAVKHWLKTWLFECLAIIRYSLLLSCR